MNEKCKAREGEWALIVGASTGLGKAWAMECAKRGYHIMVCSRRLEKLKEVTREIREQYDVQTHEFICDISSMDALEIITDAISGYDIGMCIYNAAIETGGYFIKVDEQYHRQQLIGNAALPTLLAHRICRMMAKRHHGYMLLISSMAGVIGTANQASYSGCKSLMALLGESLWYEMKKYGVYVAGVTVGAIDTPNYKAQQERQKANKEEGSETQIFSDIDIASLDPSVFGEHLQKEDAHSPEACTPEDAAAFVMENIGEGPRLFTSPGDEAAYYGLMQTKRDVGVSLMGAVTDMHFNAYTEFNSADADTFAEIAYHQERPEAKFNLETPIKELFADSRVREIIKEELPAMTKNPLLTMLPMSLKQLASQANGELQEEQLSRIESKLAEID